MLSIGSETSAYAELDVASNFSFLRGASHPDELVYRAAELGYAAIAITDVNSLAGVVRAHEAAQEVARTRPEKPLKLLIGARLRFTDAPDVLVWAMDRFGYGRLCRLLTLGKRRAPKGECHLTLADLLQNAGGLQAALSAAPDLRSPAELREPLHQLRQAFGDRLSLAAGCLYGGDDEGRLRQLAEVARESDVPLLATNHVHYHDVARRQLQDLLTCVREGCTIHEAGFRLFANGERHLKEPAQMQRLFSQYPAALRRGLHIAEQCTFSLKELRYEYPDELTPPGLSTIDYLRKITWEGAHERYPQGISENVRTQVEHELELIDQLNFAPYFLTVYDLVKYARSRGILCQGRGSAANSAVCYCIGVTAVDPDRIDVLFERFVSAARGEPPDIDIDFEHERREEVLQYLYEKYGRERAGMTAEVITYRGRSAVRDVGKAMGLSADLVDHMARSLDWWDHGTVNDQRLTELGIDPANPAIRQVMDLSAQLLGFPRHLSQHVGGMVMTRGPLCELVPIENAAMPDRTVIEWDKNDIDALGILKVDCLGLGMLTCISKCLKFVNQSEIRNPQSEIAPIGNPLTLATIPPEDPSVYQMICNADTVGVFQIESRAQMSMLPRLRPRCFYDLVIEVAIVRPGPIQGDMVHPYLRRRSGEETVTYPSEEIRHVLEKTMGVPLFQEQAMRLAIVGAGFTPEEADKLRRAMAAWRRYGALEMFHRKILEGMTSRGYSLDFAERCFLQIRGFGEYGFPESHAASFALLVYASAWLKRYHPAAFAAALLNSQPMGFYAPAQIVRDAKEHNVQVLPADANFSTWDCTLEGPASAPPCLRLGFRLIKGIKQSEMDRLAVARQKHGPFTSIQQCRQVTGLSKSTLQRLAEADAFGSLKLTRRQALWQVMALEEVASPLFDHQPDEQPPSQLPVMPLGQEVTIDYAHTGLSLKSHPAALARAELEKMRVTPNKQIPHLPHGQKVKVGGIVLIRQRPGTASGVVFITLEDETGIVNLIIWPKIYERYRRAARTARLLIAEGTVQRQGQVIHVLVRRLFDASELVRSYDLRSRDFH